MTPLVVRTQQVFDIHEAVRGGISAVRQSLKSRINHPMESNFRIAESKISMRAMHPHNKITIPLGAGDAIL